MPARSERGEPFSAARPSRSRSKACLSPPERFLRAGAAPFVALRCPRARREIAIPSLPAGAVAATARGSCSRIRPPAPTTRCQGMPGPAGQAAMAQPAARAPPGSCSMRASCAIGDHVAAWGCVSPACRRAARFSNAARATAFTSREDTMGTSPHSPLKSCQV